MEEKQITLKPNQPPRIDGTWAVGEVLQMAQVLAHWVESLSVPSTPPQQEPQPPKRDK